MLEYMRKNSNNVVVWLIIGAIAMVFVFFGIGGGGGSAKTIRVNSEEISVYEFNDMLKMANRNQPDGFSDTPGADRQLKNQVAAMLVQRALVGQFAANTGLRPTDQAVARNIANTAEFQVGGQFSRAVYDDFLHSRRTNAGKYESEVRQSILFNRATDLIQSLSPVRKPQALEFLHFREDKVKLDYLFFSSTPHQAGLTPTEDQLTAFYALNQDKWRQSASMVLEYVDIRPIDYLDKVTVPEATLEDHYNESIQRFTTDETAEVFHILFAFPNLNPNAEEKKATLERAQAAYERSKNEDFTALVNELSDDQTSQAQGGRLGLFPKNVTLPELQDVIFNSPLGQVNAPAETPAGYHLFKVASRQEAGVRPLADVRDILEGELKTFETRRAAVAELEELIVRTETNPKLADAAASMGLTAKTSESFTLDTAPDFFEDDAAAVQKAFAAPLGQVAPAIEKDAHLTVYVPLSRQESRIPPLNEVRESVTQVWIAHEAGRLAMADALAFVEKGSFTEGQAKSGSSELLPRRALGAAVPFNSVRQEEMNASLYSVVKAGDVSPLPVYGTLDGEAGCFVLSVAEFEPVSEALLENPGNDFAQEYYILFYNQMNMMTAVWNQELYEASKNGIKVPAEFVE